tara:strand:- start:103 stop:1005 length:903 start_codon:yes stop_codon:yes gene_type:complete
MSEEGTGIRVGADQNPTQAQVQALFDYCPERGLLTNRFTRSRLSRLGDQAGWFTKAGRQVSVNGKSYPVKKIIWLYVTGEFPTGGYIINKNNNKQDDRIDNLEFFEGEKTAIFFENPDLPTQEEVREYFNYHPRSGRMTYRKTYGPTRLEGQIIGRPHIKFDVCDVGAYHYPVARLVWLGHRGEWVRNESRIRTYVEEDVLGHKNGNQRDNRIGNLERRVLSIVDDEERRLALLKVNRTEIAGINWDTERQKFIARIVVDGRNMLVGAYSSVQEAEVARVEAIKEIEESDKILAEITGDV